MHTTGLLFLVIAVSIDGFGVGVSYGMQSIRLPLIGMLIITLCSGVTVLVSMTVGDFLASLIDPGYTKALGGVILIFLGGFALFRTLNDKQQPQSEAPKAQQSSFRSLLEEPGQADLDQSGSISANEALLLGSALALDAFGAGLGAAIIGYPPWLTAVLIGCMSGAFVYGGIRIGIILSQKKLKKLTYVPSILLIFIGFLNLFK